MTNKEAAAIKQILENGSKDYVSPLYSIQQYKKGNCPLSDVEASLAAAMQEHAELMLIELGTYNKHLEANFYTPEQIVEIKLKAYNDGYNARDFGLDND